MSTNGHIEFTSGKSLFRIGEVSRLTDTKPFVLRYWETEFPMLQPVKSPKGHRLYRREDVETVRHIKRLLYDEGFTIAGARRHLRESTDLPQEAVQHSAAQYPAIQYPASSHDETQGDLEQAFAEADPSDAVAADEDQFSGAQLSESPSSDAGASSEARRTESQFFARSQPPAPPPINRQVLLDLRDSLRAFLTLLESE